MKFGESLRKERELRGISLDEISQQTKVHPRFLEAIENDDLSVLPAKAFAKGFLRSYARMVDLDEELVITNFEYCHRVMQHHDKTGVRGHSSSPKKGRKVIFFFLFLIIMTLVVIIVLLSQGYWQFN